MNTTYEEKYVKPFKNLNTRVVGFVAYLLGNKASRKNKHKHSAATANNLRHEWNTPLIH